MDRRVTLPGFPAVEVYYHETHGEGTVTVEYCGWPEELIAAGVVTEQMLAPRVWRRLDADGHRFRLVSYYRHRDGQPTRYYRIRRFKPSSYLDQLPGARAARDAYDRWDEWVAGGRGQQHAPRRAVLRLVVDNTRATS